MRVNLGWGYDPNDPCEYSWTWGDVVDKQVELQAKIQDFRVVGGLSRYEGRFRDLVFRRGEDHQCPRFEVKVSGPASKVQIEILRQGSQLVTVDAAWDAAKDVYVAMWSDWKSSAWDRIPDDIPVGEYKAKAKIVAEDGGELDSSGEKEFYVVFEVPQGLSEAERKAFLYDDHRARDDNGVWFGAGEKGEETWRHGWDEGLTYYLHPFSEKIFEIAVKLIDGLISQAQAARTLADWAEPYGKELRVNCSYTGILPPGKRFKYTTCVGSNDTHQLLDRVDQLAQCADSASLLVALLRGIGIAAHPVTADADQNAPDCTPECWAFDTWSEAFVDESWTVFHPHEGLGPNTRVQAGAWGPISNKAHNDIIIMGGPHWASGDLDDADSDVDFGYTGGEPDKVLDTKPWVVELCEDYWGQSHYSSLADILAGEGQRNDTLTTRLTLNKSSYSVGETLSIDFAVFNHTNNKKRADLIIKVMSDDPLTSFLGDEMLASFEELVTVPRRDSIIVKKQYVLSGVLSASNVYHVEGICGETVSRASFSVAPHYAVSVDAPAEVVLENLVSFPVSCSISNESDETLNSLALCLKGSHNLNIATACQNIGALAPHSSATLDWNVNPLESGLGTLYFKITSENGGGDYFAKHVDILSGPKLDIGGSYIVFDGVLGEPVEVEFKVRNIGDLAASNISVGMLLPEHVNAQVTAWGIGSLAGGEEVTLHSTITFAEAENFILDISAADNAGHTAQGIIFVNAYKKPQPLVALTGHYSDHPIDTDGDGIQDYLVVGAEVALQSSGYCVMKARLVDTNGEEIVWAQHGLWLEAGQSHTIWLSFDGTAIYDHGVNGPYHVRDVYVYHTGDPTLSDYAHDACTTAAYRYTQFGVTSVNVTVDIKPGSASNPVNPKAQGAIPVGILSTSVAMGDDVDFSATTVNPATVRFGPYEAAPTHSAIEDIDGDGDDDLVLQFKMQETGIAEGDTEACLRGQTTDGRVIEGCDAIAIVPPEHVKPLVKGLWAQKFSAAICSEFVGDTINLPAADAPVGLRRIPSWADCDEFANNQALETASRLIAYLNKIRADFDVFDEFLCVSVDKGNFEGSFERVFRLLGTEVKASRATAQGQVLALLLNLVSERLVLSTVVSADDMLSDALNYVLPILADNGASSDDLARVVEIVQQINEDKLLVDADLIPGASLMSPSVGHDMGSEINGQSASTPLPSDFTAVQSYPNPFNPSATIDYGLPACNRVVIEIYDVVGRKVVTLVDDYEAAGYHSVVWNGKDSQGSAVPSGVYFCRIQFGSDVYLRKMMLLR
jgi:hypothetical protein